MIDKLTTSGDWQIIKPHIEARIEELRVLLEEDSDQQTTSRIRVEIAGLRWLIGEVETPAPDAPPSGYTARHGHPS